MKASAAQILWHAEMCEGKGPQILHIKRVQASCVPCPRTHTQNSMSALTAKLPLFSTVSLSSQVTVTRALLLFEKQQQNPTNLLLKNCCFRKLAYAKGRDGKTFTKVIPELTPLPTTTTKKSIRRHQRQIHLHKLLRVNSQKVVRERTVPQQTTHAPYALCPKGLTHTAVKTEPWHMQMSHPLCALHLECSCRQPCMLATRSALLAGSHVPSDTQSCSAGSK